MRFAHAFAALAVAACLSAAAAVPTNLSYQGYLTSPTGVPVNTTVSMEVKLYNALTGGGVVWSDTQSVAVVNGVYNVVLGSVANPLDENVLAVPLYLTVAVNGDPDMAPRTPLASAPYAILAKALDGTLPVEKGGTGLDSIATGGLLYGQGTSAPGVTGAGTLGQVLTATAGGVPQWSSSSTPNLLISHPGPGVFTIQTLGQHVAVQGTTFDFSGIGLASGTALSVDGLQVVGARQPAVIEAMNATGIDVGSAGPAQVVTIAEYNALVAIVNDLRARLQAHGLISP